MVMFGQAVWLPGRIMMDGNKGKIANSIVISLSFSGMCHSPLHINCTGQDVNVKQQLIS